MFLPSGRESTRRDTKGKMAARRRTHRARLQGSEAELQVVVLVDLLGAAVLASVAGCAEAVLRLDDDLLVVHQLEGVLRALLLADAASDNCIL